MNWKRILPGRPHAAMLILLGVGAVIGAFTGRAFVRAAPDATPAPAAAPPTAQEAGNRLELSPAAERDAGLVVTLAASGSVAAGVRATGQFVLNEDRTWHLSSLTEGKVTAVLVNLGDVVRQGQVLAYLHSHDVHDTRGAYRAALAELDRARAAAELARRIDARARRLLALTAISQEAAEQTAHDLAAAGIAVRKAEAAVEKERLHMTDVLEVSPDPQGGGADADQVPLKAPAAGVVVRRFATVGSVLTPGSEAFTITDPGTLWLLASVNEADLPFVRPGMAARMTVRAYPDTVFHGRVMQLGEELDPTTRTLKVRVAVPNPGGRLKPEMFAAVELERGGARPAIFLPESAAQEINGQKVIFVETAVRAYEARPVRIAETVDGRMRIEEGVREGERVVTAGSFALKSELLKASLR